MAAERKRHYAAEKLSPKGRETVDRGLTNNDTYQQIVDALKAGTGEKLPISSLQRYHANKWFPMRKVLEETDHLHGLVRETLEKSNGKKLDEVSSELLKTHLFNAMAALKSGDPLALYDRVISEGRLGVEKERLAHGAKRLALQEERIKVLREQVKDGGEKATLFIEFLNGLAGYLKGHDQEALKYLQPHIRGFAAEIKRG